MEARRAGLDQGAIGWRNFMEGKISKQFREIQREHLTFTHPAWSADTWVAQLVYHLFQFTHGMWIHLSNVVHERDQAGMELKERTTLKAEM